jgi:hypothetical protein
VRVKADDHPMVKFVEAASDQGFEKKCFSIDCCFFRCNPHEDGDFLSLSLMTMMTMMTTTTATLNPKRRRQPRVVRRKKQ